MDICIVYEINNREFNNCVLLERVLKKRGHNVRICNKREDPVFFKSYDVTIIPNSYRTSDVDYYRYIFNTKNNVMIVYPCEQVTNHELPEYYDHISNKVKELPHMCWGQDYYNWISSMDYDTSVISITGAIHLDFCREQFRSVYKKREELAEKYGLNINKKWLLFISDFVLSNEIRFKTSIKTGAINEEKLSAKRDFEYKSKDEILKWLLKFLSENEDYQVIYRKHPVEILTDEMVEIEKKYRNKFYLISELSIENWIFNSDVVTSWNSTVVVECYVGNIKLGLLRPYEFSEDSMMNEYTFYKDYPAIKNYQEFYSAVKFGVHDYSKETIQEIKKLYSIQEIPSCFRIADAIEQIFSSWRNMPLEKNYRRKRGLILWKQHIFFKAFVKKIFQLVYRLTGFRFGNSDRKKIAVSEWIASVDNKRNINKLRNCIDSILDKYYGNLYK